VETFETFYSRDWGSDAARAAALARYDSLTRSRTTIVAVVSSPSFGPGWEVWSTDSRTPERSATVRVEPDGRRWPCDPPALESIDCTW
jgi:hypothetical protein